MFADSSDLGVESFPSTWQKSKKRTEHETQTQPLKVAAAASQTAERADGGVWGCRVTISRSKAQGCSSHAS
jgi:hypothetical protein